VADFAAIALVNARLLNRMEDRASSLQVLADKAQTEQRVTDAILLTVRQEMRQPIEVSRTALSAW